MEQKYIQRINALRQEMKKENIALYLIMMNDYHGSEYIAAYFKQIAYYSGFTGSAGTLVVTQEEAFLWTDGRYFLQAEDELAKSNVQLKKMGEEGVPAVADYVVSFFKNLYQNPDLRTQKLGFDGRLVCDAFVRRLQKKWAPVRGHHKAIDNTGADAQSRLLISCGKDLAGQIWASDTNEQRPELRQKKIWALTKQEHGMEAVDKLKALREKMEEKGADIFVFSALDEIAWITNLRGDDIAYNPVFYSYMILTKESAVLYLQEVSHQIRQVLHDNGIQVRAYDDFYKDLRTFHERIVYVDDKTANYLLVTLLRRQNRLHCRTSPAALMKAVKNQTEIDNERRAHIMDGVALTRFIYWLKTRVRTGAERATEISAAEKLESLRREGEGYLGQSFAPIIAYKEHGAIVHYEAKEDSNAVLGGESFLLADTGGHYLTGTTDVTRTIAMGRLSPRQKTCYTAVLQGHLHLSDAKCRQGMQGCHLDYLAREPLFRLGLNFNHGTGHGVGYLLNVHEGPNAFRLKPDDDNVILPGMITSDEPGFYQAGEYGIRLENLILCVGLEETEYGQFIGFEPLTLVPFEPEAIDAEMLTQQDRKLLNAYHAKVYESIGPYLNEEERNWLCQQTKPI